MGIDVITSLSLLGLNVVFISLGGLGMSLLESKQNGKEVERFMNITSMVENAAFDEDRGIMRVNMTTLKEDAETACTNSKLIPWTYGQSFNFALSIITTVGWGVMSPSSYSSKAVVCLYALFGIPIYAMFIALIKDKCGKCFRKSVRVPRDASWYWIPLCITIIVTLFMNIAISLAVEMLKKKLKELLDMHCKTITPYSYWQENSTLWDGIYFSFITVTTIGFGDTYLRLMECEDQSVDSVASAVAGFFLFSVLLGMAAHLFDVISEKSTTGLASLSSKMSKRMSSSCSSDGSRYGTSGYGNI